MKVRCVKNTGEAIRALLHSRGIKDDDEIHLYTRKQFVKYVTEYDRRRETNFIKTFPQLKEFYEKYKS